MKAHRVAILGGGGFIGRYVVKRLAERGDVLAVGGRNAAQDKFLKLKGDDGELGPVDQFLNRFAAMPMVSPALPLIGGGDTRFQPVYVGNVADAVVRCIDDSATAGRTYELGGPRVYSLRALFELLLAEIRRHRLLLDIPFGLASLQARLMSVVPCAPLTPD